MDLLLICLVSAFAIVTTILCVVCSRSPKEKRQERVILYHHDGYEIEPANVPQFESTWRNEQWGSLPTVQLKHQNSKGGPRS
jgi:hypothetical protein